MRFGREEEQDPAERQEDDGGQVDGETPSAQTEAARKKSLLHDTFSGHASDANNVRGQETNAGQTENDVESCAGADDDERKEDSKDHGYSASIKGNIHAGSNLQKSVWTSQRGIGPRDLLYRGMQKMADHRLWRTQRAVLKSL